jgi:RES domain-containing protein
MAETEKRAALRQKLEAQGFTEGHEYGDRAGQNLSVFFGPGKEGATIPLTPLTGTFYRVIARGSGPLDLPPVMRCAGRFHSAGDPPRLYASSSATAALREFARAFNDRLVQSALAGLKLVAISVDGLPVADLRQHEIRAELGFPDPVFAEGTAESRRLARVLGQSGARGLLAPSPVAPDEATLVVFGVTSANVAAVSTDSMRVARAAEQDASPSLDRETDSPPGTSAEPGELLSVGYV